MGGTFDVLHKGHEALLERAFEVGDAGVFVGVTSDAFAGSRRARAVRPYEDRARAVASFLAERGFASRAEVGPIDDPAGRAYEARFDTIVATPETRRGVVAINRGRRARGLPSLAVVYAPIVLAEDGVRLSATRVRAGEVDAGGRLVEPVRVAVGTTNAAKVEAVRRVVARLHARAEVRGFAVASSVPEQPRGAEAFRGASSRAAAALAEWPQAHFGVGVEAGLARTPIGVVDVQWCVVIDAGARATAGHGAGFAPPPAVLRAVEEGRPLGDAVGELAGDPDVGAKAGAIGWLSQGLLDRASLTEQALVAAWLPRLRPHLYGIDREEFRGRARRPVRKT